MFFKIGVLGNISQYSQENICIGARHNKFSGLYLKEIQHRCFHVNIAKFYEYEQLFYRTPPVAAFVSLIM